MSGVRELAKSIPCDYCLSISGVHCVTASGAWATYSHAARTQPLYAAWIEGFHEGQRDAVGALDSDSAWGESYIARIRREIAREQVTP